MEPLSACYITGGDDDAFIGKQCERTAAAERLVIGVRDKDKDALSRGEFSEKNGLIPRATPVRRQVIQKDLHQLARADRPAGVCPDH